MSFSFTLTVTISHRIGECSLQIPPVPQHHANNQVITVGDHAQHRQPPERRAVSAIEKHQSQRSLRDEPDSKKCTRQTMCPNVMMRNPKCPSQLGAKSCKQRVSNRRHTQASPVLTGKETKDSRGDSPAELFSCHVGGGRHFYYRDC